MQTSDLDVNSQPIDDLRLIRPAAVEMRRSSRIAVLGLVVAFAAWCAHSLHADLVRVSFAPMWRSWGILLLATLLSFLSYTLRVVRWRWYLCQLGHPFALWFSAITYVAGFAFTLSPGKIGEVMRARYYIGRNVPLGDVAAAFCVERLMDALAMLALAALILTGFPHYIGMLWPIAIAITVGLLSLVVLPWSAIAGFAASSRPPSSLLVRISVRLARTLDSARALLRPRAVIFGFFMGVGAWCLEGVGLIAISSMFAPAHVNATVVIGIYGAAVLLGALSFMPGGLGSTEAVMIALLAAVGYAVADATVVVFACRIVTLWLGIFLGWIAVIILRISRRV